MALKWRSSWGLWWNYPMEKMFSFVADTFYEREHSIHAHILALGPVAFAVAWRRKKAVDPISMGQIVSDPTEAIRPVCANCIHDAHTGFCGGTLSGNETCFCTWVNGKTA